MSFLKPEPKITGWKMIIRSREFIQFALIIGLCLFFIAVMLIMLSKWDKIFPSFTAGKTPSSPSQENILPLQVKPSGETPAAPSDSNNPVSPTPVSPLPPATGPVTPVIHSDVITSETSTLFRIAIGRLDGVIDRTPMPLEPDEYYNSLISELAKMPPEEISKKAVQVKYKDLMAQPEKYRGVLVKIQGDLMMAVKPFKYPVTNPAGIENYYREGTVFNSNNPDKEEIYRFHLIDRPAKYKAWWPEKGSVDPVWVEGAFFKIERYGVADPKSIEGYKDAPLIIGRRMGGVPFDAKAVSQLQLVIGGVLLLVMLIAIILIIFSGKKDKLHQQQQMEKWKKKVEERKKPNPPQT